MHSVPEWHVVSGVLCLQVNFLLGKEHYGPPACVNGMEDCTNFVQLKPSVREAAAKYVNKKKSEPFRVFEEGDGDGDGRVWITNTLNHCDATITDQRIEDFKKALVNDYLNEDFMEVCANYINGGARRREFKQAVAIMNYEAVIRATEMHLIRQTGSDDDLTKDNYLHRFQCAACPANQRSGYCCHKVALGHWYGSDDADDKDDNLVDVGGDSERIVKNKVKPGKQRLSLPSFKLPAGACSHLGACSVCMG